MRSQWSFYLIEKLRLIAIKFSLKHLQLGYVGSINSISNQNLLCGPRGGPKSLFKFQQQKSIGNSKLISMFTVESWFSHKFNFHYDMREHETLETPTNTPSVSKIKGTF